MKVTDPTLLSILWQNVYVAAVRAGNASITAERMADYAVAKYKEREF